MPKKKTAPLGSTENLVKPTKNNVFCPAKKKDKPGKPTVIRKSWKTLGKSTFSATWRDGPSRSNRVAPRGKPWDHSDAPWKTLLKPWFLHVCADGTWEIQVEPFARLGESDGYSETLENLGKINVLSMRP